MVDGANATAKPGAGDCATATEDAAARASAARVLEPTIAP
jgi:hypothetical protein